MSTAATAEAPHDEKKRLPRDPAREVVETVVFVVVLVLLLKLFVTEAFVIPTGSMAETLYGYQKVVTCPKCGHEFPVNSHDEVEANQQTNKKHAVVRYCCPNCRHQGRVEDLNPRPTNRTGDRVLVLKPLFHLRPPHRGDVVVFKYPEKPQENHVAANYIKRAMGFGGETVAVHRGDLFATTALRYPDGPLFPRPDDPLDLWKPPFMYPNSGLAERLFEASRKAGFPAGPMNKLPADLYAHFQQLVDEDALRDADKRLLDPSGAAFEMVRKLAPQLLADRRIVWDNDKQAKELVGLVRPRWEASGTGRWNADDPQQPRAFAHSGGDLDWLRYQHLVWKPDGGSKRLVPWRWPLDKEKPVAGPVDNMLGYNAGTDWNPDAGREQSRDEGPDATRWVGDLTLECEVQLAAGSEVVLELSRGANRFQAKFGNGQVALARIGEKGPEFGNPTRACKVNAGTYELRFANVDAHLSVWVDGTRIDFGTEGDYSPIEPAAYEPEDKEKEGWTRANDIDAPAGIGARGPVAAVKGIRLYRDVFYTRGGGDQTQADIYYVQPGHFLCLGDNSAQSSDSRKWGTVPERLMLGKAVFVFWPALPAPNRVGFIK